MKNQLFVTLASASLFLSLASAPAAVINQNFATDPLLNGWKIAGATNLFHWDSTNQNLAVTWDSAQPNGFFYYGLDGYLTRYDDFTFQFDLLLHDIASNTEPGKTGPVQIGIGFQNYSVATNSSYLRGFGLVSDIAEFDYYPYGFYDFGGGFIYEAPPSTVPSFVSGTPTFSPNTLKPDYVLQFPTGVVVHVTMKYTADNQTASVRATTNGIAIGTVPDLVLNGTNSNFTASDNYNVNMFSITSYTSIGDDFDSLLAHGTVANLQIVLPPPAQNLALAFTNGNWQVSFNDKTNWLYTLERSTNFASWSGASAQVAGNGTTLALQDTNAPAASAYYRVRANRP